MPVLGSKNLFRILEIGTGWMALDALGAGTRQLSALVVAARWRLLVSQAIQWERVAAKRKYVARRPHVRVWRNRHTRHDHSVETR
jgi:hypothetical protein